MKTEVSIPDDLFEQGEQIARRLGISRSKLYARALRAHLKDAEITAQINEALAEMGDEPDENALFLKEAASRTAARNPW